MREKIYGKQKIEKSAKIKIMMGQKKSRNLSSIDRQSIHEIGDN